MRTNYLRACWGCFLPLILALLAFVAVACGGDAEPTAAPEPSPASRGQAENIQDRTVTAPTETVAATLAATLEPTATPEPTPTAVSAAAAPTRTSAPEPTATPAPTAAPQPTAAPEPTATMAATDSEQAQAPPEPPATPPAAAECRLVPGQDEPGQPGEVALNVEVVVDGLEIPWGLAVLPNGDLLVTERPGRVRLIQNGEVVPEPVLEFGVSILPPLFGNPLAGSEGGLLGILLHPEFAVNRQFYIFANIDNEDGVQVGRIERYVLAADGRSATFNHLILDGLPAGLHHQGGRMRIGPDGMLYVGIGAYDPPEAQNPDTLAGKLLRMDLDGGIPADNPDPDSYVFVSGIRNTQGYDWFDDRHIVMVDHGPSGFELGMPDLAGFDELNVVAAGNNLGWPRVWGCDNEEGLVSPALAWEGSVPPTGATFYRGDRIPQWTGSFLFTTVGLVERFTGRPMYGRHLHRVVLDGDDPYTVVSNEVYLQNAHGRLRTIVEAPDGYIYMMTSNCDNRGECPPEGDVILRIGPAQ